MSGVTSSLHSENVKAVKHMVADPAALQQRCDGPLALGRALQRAISGGG